MATLKTKSKILKCMTETVCKDIKWNQATQIRVQWWLLVFLISNLWILLQKVSSKIH